MILKQNFKNHLKVSEFTLTITVILVIGWWYFDFDYDYLKVVGIFHLINTIPALYLHLEYTIKNWNQTVVITSYGIETIKDGVNKKYSKDELQKIIVVKAASLDKGGIRLTPIESYYYSRIMIKNGEEIIITCLISPDIEDAIIQLNGVPFERKKKLFCSIEPI